jgi:hypothetical protein
MMLAVEPSKSPMASALSKVDADGDVEDWRLAIRVSHCSPLVDHAFTLTHFCMARLPTKHNHFCALSVAQNSILHAAQSCADRASMLTRRMPECHYCSSKARSLAIQHHPKFIDSCCC